MIIKQNPNYLMLADKLSSLNWGVVPIGVEAETADPKRGAMSCLFSKGQEEEAPQVGGKRSQGHPFGFLWVFTFFFANIGSLGV